MTDNLLISLEEKIMVLLTELEGLRKDVSRMQHENAILKTAQLEHTKKLQGLISLLDALDEAPETQSSVSHELGMFQETEEEYRTA